MQNLNGNISKFNLVHTVSCLLGEFLPHSGQISKRQPECCSQNTFTGTSRSKEKFEENNQNLHTRSLNIRKSINKIKSIEILKRIAIVIDVNVALKMCTFIFLRDTREFAESGGAHLHSLHRAAVAGRCPRSAGAT